MKGTQCYSPIYGHLVVFSSGLMMFQIQYPFGVGFHYLQAQNDRNYQQMLIQSFHLHWCKHLRFICKANASTMETCVWSVLQDYVQSSNGALEADRVEMIICDPCCCGGDVVFMYHEHYKYLVVRIESFSFLQIQQCTTERLNGLDKYFCVERDVRLLTDFMVKHLFTT